MIRQRVYLSRLMMGLAAGPGKETNIEQMRKRGNPITGMNRYAIFLPVMVLSVLLLAMNCSQERQPRKKQIILISIDTLRADHLDAHGYFRQTAPNLSRLIGDSLYYTQAYPNGCWTIPSHISLLTGTLPSRHGINTDWKSINNQVYPKLNSSLKSIAEVLKSHNIKTLKFAQLPDTLGFGRGFDKNRRLDPFSTNRKFSRLLEEIERHKKKDFFLFIHTWMVHAPYTNDYFLAGEQIDRQKRYYIEHFRVLGKKSKYISRDFADFLIKNRLFNVKDCITLYDSGIRYVDGYIGKIIDKTRRLGIYDDLMIIIVSDHGEHFSEHFAGKFYDYHGKDFYEEFIKIPLIIKYPGHKRAGIKNDPVSLIDVVPTILDYFNFDIPPFVQGESLLIHPDKNSKKYLISEAVSESDVERKMIRTGDLKYIVTMPGPLGRERVNWPAISQRRLFDLKNDPLEKTDLYGSPKFRQICLNLEKLLQKIIADSVNDNLSAGQAEIDTQTLEQMRALGYLKLP